MYLEQYFYKFCEKTRHELRFEFTGDEEIDRAIQLVIGCYIRSMNSCINREKTHPPLQVYAKCLSEDFAHNALIKAMEKGFIPKYSKQMAKKYQVAERCSHCYMP